ncbi:MAG TPA: hypothetical protein V6C46_09095 [Coleofasciculaceae cyanobacterium]
MKQFPDNLEVNHPARPHPPFPCFGVAQETRAAGEDHKDDARGLLAVVTPP